MITLPPPSNAAELEVGERVRLTELEAGVPASAEGRVIGFYRVEPPRTLVAFEHGPCPVLASRLERVA
jgi:hypothetical protein